MTQYLKLRGIKGTYDGKQVIMMPSCDLLFLVSEDSVESTPTNDFLNGLNKRELE